jgi:hypothetical protein
MEALRTCCLNANSLGGMRTREQSLLVASLTRRLFGLVWQDLYFAVGSYNFATTFLATHIEDSRSGSLSCERSGSSADEDLIRCFSNNKDSRSGITTSQSMNRWENFTSYARQRTTQVMNWYISPTILNASNRTYQDP